MTITRCGLGHPTRERQPGEWMLSCGCEASTAVPEARTQHFGHDLSDGEWAIIVASWGTAPT